MTKTIRRLDKAFTLPALATVVAMTGLLGLFLAPLVVQLKSQQESNICLTNLRRLGQATLMYAQDYDQTMPLTTSNVNGQWLTNFPHMVPVNWSSLTTHPAVIGSKCIWPNTALSYGITLDTLKCPSQESYRYGNTRFTYSTPLAPPAAVGYTMNGLLSTYSIALVSNPARVPLIWEGRGRSGFLGGVLQNPLLGCADGTQPCRFSSAEAGNGAANGGTGSMFGLNGSIWTHGRENHWLFADGHVEARKLGAIVLKAGSSLDTDPSVDPYRSYNERGIPNFIHTDGAFPIAFRPDR